MTKNAALLKCGTSKVEPPPLFIYLLGIQDTHLYNPLKHMSQGEVGYGHIFSTGMESMLSIKKQRGHNGGSMQLSSLMNILKTNPAWVCHIWHIVELL
jgi:hypothetical protein